MRPSRTLAGAAPRPDLLSAILTLLFPVAIHPVEVRNQTTSPTSAAIQTLGRTQLQAVVTTQLRGLAAQLTALA